MKDVYCLSWKNNNKQNLNVIPELVNGILTG